jgi:hypothetical protein
MQHHSPVININYVQFFGNQNVNIKVLTLIDLTLMNQTRKLFYSRLFHIVHYDAGVNYL